MKRTFDLFNIPSPKTTLQRGQHHVSFRGNYALEDVQTIERISFLERPELACDLWYSTLEYRRMQASNERVLELMMESIQNTSTTLRNSGQHTNAIVPYTTTTFTTTIQEDSNAPTKNTKDESFDIDNYSVNSSTSTDCSASHSSYAGCKLSRKQTMEIEKYTGDSTRGLEGSLPLQLTRKQRIRRLQFRAIQREQNRQAAAGGGILSKDAERIANICSSRSQTAVTTAIKIGQKDHAQAKESYSYAYYCHDSKHRKHEENQKNSKRKRKDEFDFLGSSRHTTGTSMSWDDSTITSFMDFSPASMIEDYTPIDCMDMVVYCSPPPPDEASLSPTIKRQEEEAEEVEEPTTAVRKLRTQVLAPILFRAHKRFAQFQNRFLANWPGSKIFSSERRYAVLK